MDGTRYREGGVGAQGSRRGEGRDVVNTITVTYVQHEDEWAVTVTGLGHEEHANAPGIIAARDRAEQLIEKLTPEETRPTVVHLLDGSALQFTSTYMAARLARNDIPFMDELDEEHDGDQIGKDQTPEDGQEPVAESDTGGKQEATEQPMTTPDEFASSTSGPDPKTPETAEEKAENNAGPGRPRGSEQEHGVPRKALHKTPEAAGPEQGNKHDPDTARVEAEFAGTTAAPDDHV